MAARLSIKPALERFNDQYTPCPMSGCWLWTGCTGAHGYGVFRDQQKYGRRYLRAHRWSHETHVGPIPEGLVLDHLCRTPACVNPAHLEPVTDKENTMRGVGVGAKNARKTHCNHGHPLSGENLLVSSGKRRCRECLRGHFHRWYDANRRAS